MRASWKWSALPLAVALLSPLRVAAVPCSTLPAPVYLAGAASFRPVAAGLGSALAGSRTVVFQSVASCSALQAITGGNLFGTASYWDATGTTLTCDLEVAGTTPDVAISETFYASCGLPAQPSTLGEDLGPVQPYVFVVPTASSQTAITQEEAYLVYGFGAAAPIPGTSTIPLVTPWTSAVSIFTQPATSSATAVLGPVVFPARGDGPARLAATGVTASGSALMVSDVGGSAQPAATLGFVAAPPYDSNRVSLKALAFRAAGQALAYGPDARLDGSAFDRRNVRDGRYTPWGYLHYFTARNGTGAYLSLGAATLLGYLLEQATPPGASVRDLTVSAHLIPRCAMNVVRNQDGGALTPVGAAVPACGCDFESRVSGSTTCQTCAAGGPSCSSGVCRSGFCEAR
jgi:hypothetical protein